MSISFTELNVKVVLLIIISLVCGYLASAGILALLTYILPNIFTFSWLKALAVYGIIFLISFIFSPRIKIKC